MAQIHSLQFYNIIQYSVMQDLLSNYNWTSFRCYSASPLHAGPLCQNSACTIYIYIYIQLRSFCTNRHLTPSSQSVTYVYQACFHTYESVETVDQPANLNRPYRLFTFDPMASFQCLPVLARQACARRLHLMFPARICCFLILSPITNLSLNVLCTKHED